MGHDLLSVVPRGSVNWSVTVLFTKNIMIKVERGTLQLLNGLFHEKNERPKILSKSFKAGKFKRCPERTLF